MTPATIRYGKGHVVFFRLGAAGAPPLAAAVDIDVFGTRFMPAYTEGDNRDVVATDTMKNFVYGMAADYPGRTLLGFCGFLGTKLLETYPVMEAIRVSAREVALDPAAGSAGPSDLLFRLTRTDGAFAEVTLERARGSKPTGARGGWLGMVLLKSTGSSFTAFARDAYTTLPEIVDRPLTIGLDAYWRFGDPAHQVGEGGGVLAPSDLREDMEGTFHEFNSRSIQHLVHEMGGRLLARHPELAEVELQAENRTPDAVVAKTGVRVFAAPRPTYGRIGLVLRR